MTPGEHIRWFPDWHVSEYRGTWKRFICRLIRHKWKPHWNNERSIITFRVCERCTRIEKEMLSP